MTEKEYAIYAKNYLNYFRSGWSDARIIRQAWELSKGNLPNCKTAEEKQTVFVESLLQSIVNEVYRGFGVSDTDLPRFEKITLPLSDGNKKQAV